MIVRRQLTVAVAACAARLPPARAAGAVRRIGILSPYQDAFSGAAAPANQRTARALGITLPANLLLRATRVIE